MLLVLPSVLVHGTTHNDVKLSVPESLVSNLPLVPFLLLSSFSFILFFHIFSPSLLLLLCFFFSVVVVTVLVIVVLPLFLLRSVFPTPYSALPMFRYPPYAGYNKGHPLRK